MKKVMHFNSLQERLDYLKGKFEEIKPVEVKEEPKPKKAKKGKKRDGEVQAQ